MIHPGKRARRGLGSSLIAGTLIAATVVVSASMSASGDSNEATTPYVAPFGTLTIELGDRTGEVSLDLVDGTSYTQPLVTQQPCAQVGYGTVAPTSSAGNLVAMTAIVNGTTTAADSVQLPDDALGVNTGTNCGNPAGLVGPGELLEIELGPFFEQFGGEVVAESAELVIEKSHPQDKELTVGYDGGVQGSPIPVATGGETIVVQPDASFSSITIGSTSNKSARGLSVGSLTSFELVGSSTEFEVAVDCGEQVTDMGGEGEIATSAVFFRGENDPDKQVEPCDFVGVVVDIQPEGRVYWNNAFAGVNTGTVQRVNGTVTIEWAPKPVAEVGNPTEIDFDAEGPAEYIAAPWCLSFSKMVDGAGKVTFDATMPPYNGDGANSDGTAPWCLVSSSDTLNGDGTTTRVQEFFGSGDPWARH